jgi:hypothetical protein
MNIELALAYLTKRFSGQLVLYSSELAEVLGKSERALENLIARDTFPFVIQKVGGQNCVDVFQVATWLTRNLKPADSAQDDSEEKSVRTKSARTASGSKKTSGRSSLSGKLAKLRFEAAGVMRRFAVSSDDADEQGYFRELAGFLEQQFISDDDLQNSKNRWVVQVTYENASTRFLPSVVSLKLAIAKATELKSTTATSIGIHKDGTCVWVACQLTQGNWSQLLDNTE